MPRHSAAACVALVAFVSCLRVSGVSIHPPADRESEIPPAENDFIGGCWQRGDRVQAHEVVQFRIAVTQSQPGLEQLESEVLASSDPSSPAYGRHLTNRQVQQLVAPPLQSLQTVREWLSSAGLVAAQVHESANGDFITGLEPADKVEKLFGIRLHRYSCPAAPSKATIIRASEAPTLPAHVADVVDFVSPGFRFPAVRRISGAAQRLRRQSAPDPTGGITPSTLRKLYNVSSDGGKSSTSQAVASFLHEYFSPADLHAFQAQFSPKSQGRTPKVVGANHPSSPTLEASLDIQYLMTVAPAVASEFWYTAGSQPHNPGAEPFVDFLAAVASTDDAAVPKVFSISYADDENQVEHKYARRVSVELQKAAARGISLLVATGDGGVGGNTNQPCHGKPFVPTFPASSPYITAVGGTWMLGPEVGFEASAGGFSNVFARPQYQDQAVRAFLGSAGRLPPRDRFNASGRAFPDVSAQSADFPIKVHGKDDSAYGTSAATPVVAAVVSLLNDARVAAGKSTLGFVNPLLYAVLDQGLNLFNDITAGHNPGCGSHGFSAQEGWDPVTGVGTPNFGKLVDYVLTLP